ncbi:MAG: AEC family transporter [Limnohabitans sp.]
MDSAIDILGITGPIYLAIALGYFVTQRGLFSRADMQVFGKFTIQLALPALLFNALSRRSVGEILNWHYLAAYAVATLVVVLGGLFWARRVQGKPLALSSVVTMGMACSNSGFVGYPVMLLTLGSTVAGVSLALNMVVENLLIIPLLLAVAGSEGAPGQWRQAFVQTLKGLMGNPMIWGIVGGFVVSLSGLHMPEPVARTINLFSAASGALSLFVIGGSLVELKPGGLKGALAQIALGKLIVHPLVMVTVLLWLIPVADPALRMAALLTCAMPMMGIYTILAQRFGHGAISAAALLVTTVLSFFSISTLLWVLRHWPI